MEPYELSLAEASAAIEDRRLSPVELTDSVLARIEAVDADVSAYVTVVAGAARAQAAEAARDIAAGRRRGPLHGVPMALKDLIDTAGTRTASGSAVRAGRTPAADSAVAARLKEAGAVLVGKAHTHEFAYGLTTPQTRNPWHLDHVPGGSSGGSAAAVASGTATYSLGTDTGGSIRVPSALTGVVGLKPTYGLVPRDGIASLSWSLDHVGPITRTVRDAGLVLDALVGRHPGDAAGHPYAAYASRPEEGLAGVRIGVPATYYFDHVDPQVEAAVREAIADLADLGARLVDVEIPMGEYVRATQWGLMVPEATAYHEQHLHTTPELYGPDVRVLLEAGALVPATDYLRAQRVRTLMRDGWNELLREVDVVAAPTVPATAARRDQETFRWADGTVETVSDAYVRLSAPANITGLPALSVPAGFDTAGLPVGLQLIGRPLDEETVLRVGEAHERLRGPAPLAPYPFRPSGAPAPGSPDATPQADPRH
ncbi:amidase [Streptomyces sp. NPDC006512]|uniref:amidase n=1 Tax=Streptomyces sp. NPDC006512 TaxID=3154307 RepID=UPI0033B1B6C9